MARAEKYDDLIFQLGDLARERLAKKAGAPRSMERVLRAEEAILGRRDELQALEDQMNSEDSAFQQYLDRLTADRDALTKVTRQWKRAVEGVLSKAKDLRKKLVTRRAELRYGRVALKKEERKHADLEQSGEGGERLEISRQSVKRIRLAQMRMQREVESLEQELETLFDVQEGQPGAEGILAQKRLLQLEDEEQVEREDFDARMAGLDREIAQKEEELKAAQDFLDQAVFLLGEECYTKRVPDPMLAALYPRLDKAE